ncbi:hypothetical protein KRR38_32690 [Novosphingobium sp. G106]|uniref:hypothetical protein n=1 Tax=Novosphingobium sp. G106 TaxID=2849500 RepID=UPI001C2D54E5|nr:hypothetical protein [Novosphingobium sp. G106]MBV1692293.1 hypothetical protein [Novosphingobium sp. G106]
MLALCIAWRCSAELSSEAGGVHLITSASSHRAGSARRDNPAGSAADTDVLSALRSLHQDGLKSEGTLTGEGRVLTVRERVNVAHEELRYAHFWKDARFLEVGDSRNGLGLDRGDYRIERIYANGRIGLRDDLGRWRRIDLSKIDPTNRCDGLQLSNDKTIGAYGGETIRWTANVRNREMWNATIARVETVERDAVIVRLANGDHQTLPAGDPMLKRTDLAYAKDARRNVSRSRRIRLPYQAVVQPRSWRTNM